MGTLAPSLPVVDVPLSLFGGTDSELAPSDCPEGVSPDNQDVMFLPGEVFSRWGLHSILNVPTGNPILYQKSYKQPNDQVLTLFLDSSGALYAEPVSTAPGTYSSIFTVSPVLYAQSVTAFGREYLAFSDLLHGQGVPLQYDGTFLDRVTMDGPGAPPNVANYQPASATIVGSGAAINIAASSVGIQWVDGFVIVGVQWWAHVRITTTTAHGLSVGQGVVITGSTSTPSINQSWVVYAVDSATTFRIAFPLQQPSPPSGGGGTVQPTGLIRASNIVTATTTAPHGFQVGWQVQISGVANSNIGGGIASISRDGNGVVTVTTNGPHGFFIPTPAAAATQNLAIVGVTNPDTSFNGTFQVQSVLSPTIFTYQQNGTVESSSAGTGNVQDIWNTTAFIQSIPTATSFTYQQIGPSDSQAAGLASIIGQLSPGAHNCVVIFLTREGALTAPSPPVTFVANGAQQLFVSNLPIGPANVVARVLGFTGAGGDNYFIIPAVPRVGTQIVGTSLVIPDNTTSSVVIDFSDNTLFAAVPIDVIGNDLFDQAVLGPVLGFFAYESRLSAWGDYNKIENFLNMGFCGGYLSGALTAPLGWNSGSNAGGTLVNGGPWAAGQVWQITGDGTTNKKGLLTQSAFEDSFGDPVIQPSTSYLFRLWAQARTSNLNGDVVISLTSASTSFSSTVAIPIATIPVAGAFTPLFPFSLETPAVIPPDLILSVYVVNLNNGATLLLGELEMIFAENPFRDQLSRWSYVENPEGIALTTGNLGPEDDPGPIRCFSLQRNNCLLKTDGGVHEFSSNDAEPDEWTVNQITRSVGCMSLRGGDPGMFGSGDAAEDWDVSADQKGLYLFAGGDHWKISQEYQTFWDQINLAAQQTVFVKNDPHNRRIYVGIPTGAETTPNLLIVMDYRELDTAVQIAGAPPLRITLAGLMKSSDLTRKWTRFNLAMNAAEILIRPGNEKEICLGGNFGNFYFLDPAKLTDDDYGILGGAAGVPYYITYGFVNHDQEQQLQLGTGRKLAKRLTGYVTGTGLFSHTAYIDSLQNPMPQSSFRQLNQDMDEGTAQPYDVMWTTGYHGERIFYQVQAEPLPGTTDLQFRLQKLIPGLMQDPIAPRRQMAL